jgi:uncharacterized protein (DUF2249 family)
MSKEILLEVHDLQPPQPMELALDALDKLQLGEYIKMVHRMQPFPLFKILDENSFRYRVTDSDTSAFDIYIWHASDKQTAEDIKKIIG